CMSQFGQVYSLPLRLPRTGLLDRLFRHDKRHSDALQPPHSWSKLCSRVPVPSKAIVESDWRHEAFPRLDCSSSASKSANVRRCFRRRAISANLLLTVTQSLQLLALATIS